MEGKILSRLMEEPAVKRFKENSANLEHFKVVNQSAAVTVVEEKPHEEYTLPHPIWSQVHPNTPMLTLTHSVILSMKLRLLKSPTDNLKESRIIWLMLRKFLIKHDHLADRPAPYQSDTSGLESSWQS